MTESMIDKERRLAERRRPRGRETSGIMQACDIDAVCTILQPDDASVLLEALDNPRTPALALCEAAALHKRMTHGDRRNS